MARAGSRYASDTYYEFRTMTIPPDVGRSDARRLITAEAEYGRWELARSVLYEGGARKIVLRRRAMRVVSTLADH
ncbi:DUF5703 family protein [Georgenia sp. Z1491]|uniref:DUF5703 family protein n=1 Tax=Georgenia sp. Z1491 TaxID=3416707 RepID=UPI003CE962C5